MGFIATDEVKGAIISKKFLSNVDYLINGKTVIHHLHITADVIQYAHSFCNLNIRENKNQISVVVHNLCGFDFFYFLKDLRFRCVENNRSIGWRQKFSKHKFRKHIESGKVYRYVQVFPAKSVHSS